MFYLQLRLRIYLLINYGVVSLILGSIIAFVNLLFELIWSCLSCVLSTIAFVNILSKYGVVSLLLIWSCLPYFGFYNCVCEYT